MGLGFTECKSLLVGLFAWWAHSRWSGVRASQATTTHAFDFVMSWIPFINAGILNIVGNMVCNVLGCPVALAELSRQPHRSLTTIACEEERWPQKIPRKGIKWTLESREFLVKSRIRMNQSR